MALTELGLVCAQPSGLPEKGLGSPLKCYQLLGITGLLTIPGLLPRIGEGVIGAGEGDTQLCRPWGVALKQRAPLLSVQPLGPRSTRSSALPWTWAWSDGSTPASSCYAWQRNSQGPPH